VKTESKRGLSRTLEWTDVYLRRGCGTPQNVSACDGINWGEPALSPDGARVAFVKSGG
jgi:Tol biopolymer transport system component